MMKIVILGAGASHAAGYPLTSSLLPELEKMMVSTPNIVVKDAWHRFSNFREEAKGVIKRILSSTNPEVVLSLIDLYTETRKNEEQDFYTAMGKVYKQIKSGSESSEQLPDNPKVSEPEEFFKAKIAVRDFLACLSHFFAWRHYCDSKEDGTEKRQYLKQELSSLAKGDIVITMNWDTLVERVLLEDGRWLPRDGYGFQVQLKYVDSNGEPLSFTSDVTRTISEISEVQVLKLHGSLGWRENEESKLYLRFTQYLQYLPIKHSKQQIFVRDCAEPRYFREYEPVMIYPSFLKQLKTPQIQLIWHRAAEELARADEIHIIGYSLPESDTAVRTLLNTLRFRSEINDLMITVDDPNSEVRQRWKNFLGEKITLRNRSLGE